MTATVREWLTNLMAAITLVRLLSAVHPLVSVQVVALDEAHVTCIAGKWLFSCEQSMTEYVARVRTQFNRFIFFLSVCGYNQPIALARTWQCPQKGAE